MSKKRTLTAARLQMFNDGGAGAGATGGDAGASQPTAEAQPIKYEPKARRGRNSGKQADLSNVVYGKQASAEPAPENGGNNQTLAKSTPDVTTTSDTLEARRAQFEELIKGEYKDEFTQRTQQIIDRRFKDYKQNQARLDEVNPLVDTLMSRYNIADGDLKKLTEAIENDTRYWEDAAEEAGLTVEQYKRMQMLEREHRDLQEAKKRQASKEAADAQAAEWQRQADATKQMYPQFDLIKEMENDQFKKLLFSGIPVQHAYETMHLGELITGAASVAAKQSEERTVSRIKSKASRPAENGISSQAAIVIKSDVSKFTPKDRAEIARRAARGEIIEF